jgi:hypothetical protein
MTKPKSPRHNANPTRFAALDAPRTAPALPRGVVRSNYSSVFFLPVDDAAIAVSLS